MAHFLHTLGAYAFNHKWRILAAWIALLVILGVLAGQFIKAPTNSLSIPGTEAQQALDRFDELFPGTGGGSARVVFASPEGKTIQDYAGPITETVEKLETATGVASVVSPLVNPLAISKDGTIAYAQVQLELKDGTVDPQTTTDVMKIVEESRTGELQVEAGGDVIEKSPGEILGVGEIAGVILALVVLLITLGSLISAGMPLVVALISIGVSMAGLFALSQVIEIGATTPVLAVMLGLAVGIDYSLFIISKYRSYLLEGYSYKDAAAKSVATAGNAVIFAALTVVIALSALSVVNIPFMTTMGLAGAGTVAIAAVVAVTLIPALLGFAKAKVFGGKTRKLISEAQAKGPHADHQVSRKTIWYKWGAAITKRPIVTLIAAIAVIAVIALPAKDLQLGLPTDQYAATETTERKAYDLLSEGFGAGFNGPLLIVVEGLPATTDAEKAFAGPYANLIGLNKIAEEIKTVEGVEQAVGGLATEDGTQGVIQVISKTAPTDEATLGLISYLRNGDNQKALTGDDNITFAVTGTTALQSDINEKLSNALPLYLGVVVGLSLILLIVAFRSILVPIKATLGFLLSVLAMFGAMVAVFQWGWFGISEAPGPIVSFIPIIAIGVLFGLAMDYEFFLVSSMHEAYGRTKDARKSVISGFALGSKVVTAAGIIMVAVFAGFITNHDATIQAIGFGLALGILVDAFLVRMTIVPAVMMLLGKYAWWLPRWIDRFLPHISIEGEAETRSKK